MSGEQIKPGYKRTEVGVIPEDWHLCALSEVVDVVIDNRGKSPPYSGSGKYELIETSSVSFSRKYPDFSKICKFVTENVYKSWFRGHISIGDILVSTVGEYSGACVILNDARGVIAQNIVAIRLKNINAEYIFYWMRSNIFFDALKKVMMHQAQPSLRVPWLLSFKLALPNKSEQVLIAKILSDVDALLTKLDQLIAKKHDLKQATMQQLLTGQTRLPGFSGAWEVKRLGDVADMGSGGTPLSSVAAYYDGDIPWVSISDMTKGGKVIELTDRNLTEFGFANSAAQLFPVGTILYAMYASLGECSIAGIPLCTSQAILGIRPREKLYGEFLFYYLTSLKATVKTLGQQGTQANLNKGMVQNFRLSLPSVEEQAAIATVLSDMDAELATLEARSDKTRALKQGMMQELLTGRIRLNTQGVDS